MREEGVLLKEISLEFKVEIFRATKTRALDDTEEWKIEMTLGSLVRKRGALTITTMHRRIR